MKSGQNTSGFSLLEISVVLIIFGGIASMALSGGYAWIEKNKSTSTHNKMAVLDTALKAYYSANGRLPCPSDITMPESNANHGVEAPGSGDRCMGGAFEAIETSTENEVVFGGIPYKTLGLSKNMYYDGWKSAYVYYVDKDYTDAGVFIANHPDFIDRDDNSDGDIKIEGPDPAGSITITNNAAYAFVSAGGNQHGAFKASGNQTNGRASFESDERENCECSGSGQLNGSPDHRLVSRKTDTEYDDIVSYKMRSQLW